MLHGERERDSRHLPMATQSKLWPEGNESKNKTYIGRVSRAGGKTVTREWEGLVDRQGDGGGERESARGRRDATGWTDEPTKRERGEFSEREHERGDGGERADGGLRTGRRRACAVRKGIDGEGIGARGHRPSRRGAAESSAGSRKRGTRRPRQPRRERGSQPGAAACHCWRQLIVEASRH